MRWQPMLSGLGMLATAIGATIILWDAYLNPSCAEKAAGLREGMTQPEVEAVMGGEGEQDIVFVSGHPRYWNEYFSRRDYFARRWEDINTKVVVTFEGPKSESLVRRIEQSPKDGGDVSTWFDRIALSLLALSGIGLLVFGLWPHSKQSAVDAKPTSSPPA